MVPVVFLDQLLQAATNTAHAASQSVEEKRLRQALTYSRVGERLVRLRDDPAANLRLDQAAHTSILNLVRSLASESPSAAEHSLEKTIGILEDCTAPDNARASAPVKLPQDVPLAGSNKKDDPEQYSNITTKALHETFYRATILPCSCQGQAVGFRLLDQHDCALRLDGTCEVLGDETHCFFDSVISRKGQQSHEWAHIQFQLPRAETRGSFLNPVDNPTSNLESNSTPVKDICEIVRSRSSWCDHRIPIRLKGSIPDHKLYELQPMFSHDCPQNGPSISLSEARKGNLLSAKSKIHLAFAISKSFWQYYESDWMQAKWALETILLLPQRKDRHPTSTLNKEAKTPFLKIDALPLEETFFAEHEPLNCHPYPYLLNLGLLLVLLCTDKGTLPVSLSNSAEFNGRNTVYFKYVSEVHHEESSWPSLDLSEEYRKQYKSIVKHCVPLIQDLRSKAYLKAAERRQMLKDKVVLPLYELLQSMEDPDTGGADIPQIAGTQATTGADTNVDKIVVPSRLSRTWIECIISSPLQLHIGHQLKISSNGNLMRRPRVAIIDTGYDSSSRFFNKHKHKSRLSLKSGNSSQQYHWKDFWGGKDEPLDDDGHGTSMLSTVMRIAPFADICVARIAGVDNDLRENAQKTSKNLAKAIRWAIKYHQVDIISMSFGWEDEESFEGHPVVSNAIAYALENRDQKVLFFAAASNFGGGRPELFPAVNPYVFSIRATDTLGAHQNFNPALPKNGEAVYGTLGVGVPSVQRGGTMVETGRDGTSVATAVATGIAANIIGYINTSGECQSWEKIRTYSGFKNMLDEISTVTEAQKRFISLEKFYRKPWKKKFEAALTNAQGGW